MDTTTIKTSDGRQVPVQEYFKEFGIEVTIDSRGKPVPKNPSELIGKEWVYELTYPISLNEDGVQREIKEIRIPLPLRYSDVEDVFTSAKPGGEMDQKAIVRGILIRTAGLTPAMLDNRHLAACDFQEITDGIMPFFTLSSPKKPRVVSSRAT